mgnify:CR=1 FL=1
MILKEKATGDLYQCSFCDWDIDNTDYNEDTCTIEEGGRVDLNTNLTKVTAVEVTTIKYV